MQNGSFKRVRISINKDEIAKLADEKGYVALNIFERREPDTQYGNTHNITVQERNAKASDDDNEAPTTAE